MHQTTERKPPRLPRTIVVIGFVSLLNDFASEMVVPLIPLLLATVLSAGPLALGIIEGAADAVSNLLKLWAGRRSDRGHRRKPYVILGYLLSNIVRPLIAFSASWLAVLAIRVTDRVGKGVRTAPRDALIADSVPDDQAGRAFGFARALDHAGAVLGALAAAGIVYFGTERLDIVIALSAIPGIATIAIIAFGIKEPPQPASMRTAVAPPLRWNTLTASARAYLLAIGFFTLGKIPETFLLLRGHELGMSTVQLLLFWAAMHVVKVLVSEQAGRHTDRLGRRPFILSGWMLYVVTLFALAFVTEVRMLWAWGLALGFYFGLTEGAERALVRDLAPPAERGTAYGWFHMIVGSAALAAGILLGGLWSLFGVTVAFLASSGLAALGVIGFARLVR